MQLSSETRNNNEMPTNTSDKRSRRKENARYSIKLNPRTVARLREFALAGEFGSKHRDNLDIIINRLLDVLESEGTATYLKNLVNQIKLYEAIIDKERLAGRRRKKKL